MQKLSEYILNSAKKVKIRKLEEKLKADIGGRVVGEMFICPYCKYHSKKNSKGTAKFFEDDKQKSFKCFACGVWRRV